MKTLLITFALVQIGIAVLNLFLARMMKWEKDIASMPLLIREVFRVHAWFITVTLLIFGVLTLMHLEHFTLGTDPFAASFALGIACFWGFRTWLQVGFYSSSHWKGNPLRTWIHIACLLVYGSMTITYFLAASKHYLKGFFQ
jgi:hypothetical protein